MNASPLVLVVDDDLDIARALTDLLEAHGYPAVYLGDGLEALRYLRAGAKPCLILLDLRMPRMDGFAFLDAVTREPALREICTVVMTAHHELADSIQSARRVLRKPVELHDLLAVAEQACVHAV